MYQDDVTEDLKSSYVDRLHREKTGKQVTQEILQEYGYAIEDEDDAPVFWFALADMQWNYGRLEESVKERALFYIHEGSNLERWKEEAPKEAKKREQVLKKLEDKLMSPQPPEKRVSQYRLYRCSWKLGDVYAYLLEGEYAAKRGLAGEYLLFQKVDEDNWYPGHIIPIVRVKLTNGKQLPKDRDEIERLEYIQVDHGRDGDITMSMSSGESVTEKLRDDCGCPPIFRMELLNTSQRAIRELHR